MAGVGGFTKAPNIAPVKGPTPTGPAVQQPKSVKPAKPAPVQVRAHTRAAPAPKPPKPQAPKAANPLLDPSQSLSGQALLNAAQRLAQIQTQDPITELQKQIASNNQQTTGTVNLAGGYYNQLEPFVQQGVTQSGQIASGLNSQLQGINQNTQSQLQGIGQGAMGSLLKYAPDANAATADLAAQIARQQGLAAQQGQTYQGFGANQGANYQQLANSNLGTFGLQGQEALRNIAQSGTVKNEPLVAKIAGLRAQQGALAATDLGKLRQQEVANQIARAGLGLKQQTLNTTAANDQARNQLTARGQNITQADAQARIKASVAENAARLAQQNLNNLRSTNTSAANNKANNSTRVLLAQMKQVASQNKPASGAQANAIFSHIDYLTGEMQNLISHGIPPAQAYHLIQNGGRIQTGTTASGKATYRTYFPNRLGTQLLNAAYNVRPGGSGLTTGDLAWLASIGIRNPTRYSRANERKTGGAIAGAGKGVGGL